jgi:formiminoglutamase
MSKPSISQSQKRRAESLESLFTNSPLTKEGVLILKSSSDVGVMRNGGRNGARLAPQALIATLKKMTLSPSFPVRSITEYEVADKDKEEKDFSLAQELSTQTISGLLSSQSGFVLHLGGGHDHIYPLLMSFKETKKIIVINIDAHADTRVDTEAHSGTPFRQFSQTFKGEFRLFQIGLHPWANSSSTLTPLEGMSILWSSELQDEGKVKDFFKTIAAEVDQDTRVIFSLDADAMSGEIIPGVSAVNGQGLSICQLKKFWQEYRSLNFTHSPILGIYELNPVYDTLSGLSMRTMSSFVFECLQGK